MLGSALAVTMATGLGREPIRAEQPQRGGPPRLSPPPTAPQTPPREPAPSAAQEQPSVPRFRSDANFVRVDVYPTAGGRPVQDLRLEDFELREDGAVQTLTAFEHVVISPAGPQSSRTEPGSVRGAEQMAANPRNRVFVIFLDIAHAAVEGSHHIKEPLIRLIDRILGPDDLVAVMTHEMAASQITFGRKTEIIANMLRDNWTWGKRHSLTPVEQRELEYEGCFPLVEQRRLVQQMVARRRERAVLDSLKDLVVYLGGVREERKAILTITDGWVLYRPDPSMTNLRGTEPVPGKDPIGVDDWGKLRVGATRDRDANPASQTTCDRERQYLSAIDNDDHFRYIIDLANRNNASFYPIDPRGLTVFDYPLGPAAPPSLTVDAASLRTRIETSRTLAEATDGMAVVNSNDLDAGLRRIADDLTSYYLLGYYSTNTRLDGGFRKISVKVKRPGVDVRARRGYRAATAEEVDASRAAAATVVPEAKRATGAALATLDRIRADSPFAVHAAAVRPPPGAAVSAIWVAGELTGAGPGFSQGDTATIQLSGGSAASLTVPLTAGARSFLARLPVEAGTESIDVRARVAGGTRSTESLTDTTRADLSVTQPLLFRRGPITGNRVVPAADFRFSRTERLRLELPVNADAVTGAGRLLDRTGQPLPVPVQVGERTDADGQRWLTADAVLAALGAGDYVIEVSYAAGDSEQRVLTAVRVGR